MIDTQPLVTIGLPTYNRAQTLKRSIESVIAQDYTHWELTISDNGSADDTEALCNDFCARDSRIHYTCQPENLGATNNFIAVLKQARGEYFMWLADDDWLCSGFLAQCVAALEQDADCALALGQVNYYQGDHFVHREPTIALGQESGGARVLSYYAHVTENGQMYSLMRRSLLIPALMPRNVIGGDWLFIAALVFQGKARALETTCVNRSLDGTSQDRHRMAVSLGFSPMQTNHPYLCIAGFAFQEIAWASPVYASLPKLARMRLAWTSAILVWRRHGFRFYGAALARRVVPTWLYNRLRSAYRKGLLFNPESRG